jgi:hypothetical protein
MLVANYSLISKGFLNIALNSSIGYAVCKIVKNEVPKDIAIILAMDSTCRIAAKHLFDFAFGSTVDKPGNMIHFAFLFATGVIQPISIYLANKLFQAKAKDKISLFGYIALSWKINIMIKDVAFASDLIRK